MVNVCVANCPIGLEMVPCGHMFVACYIYGASMRQPFGCFNFSHGMQLLVCELAICYIYEAIVMLVRVDTAAPAEGAIRGGSHREQTPANAHTDL